MSPNEINTPKTSRLRKRPLLLTAAAVALLALPVGIASAHMKGGDGDGQRYGYHDRGGHMGGHGGYHMGGGRHGDGGMRGPGRHHGEGMRGGDHHGHRGEFMGRMFDDPDADGDGTQVNVSGAILAKYAPNKDNAEKLLAFLLSDEAQELYASGNHEYPVVPGVKPSEIVASWGELKADQTPLTKIAELRDAASALVDEVRFDEGPQNQ